MTSSLNWPSVGMLTSACRAASRLHLSLDLLQVFSLFYIKPLPLSVLLNFYVITIVPLTCHATFTSYWVNTSYRLVWLSVSAPWGEFKYTSRGLRLIQQQKKRHLTEASSVPNWLQHSVFQITEMNKILLPRLYPNSHTRSKITTQCLKAFHMLPFTLQSCHGEKKISQHQFQ